MSHRLYRKDVDAALQNNGSVGITITSSEEAGEDTCVGLRLFFPKRYLNLGNCVVYIGTVRGSKNDRPWALTFFPEGDHKLVALG